MSELLEKLSIIEDEHKKVLDKLSQPEVASNPDKIKEFGKLYRINYMKLRLST